MFEPVDYKQAIPFRQDAWAAMAKGRRFVLSLKHEGHRHEVERLAVVTFGADGSYEGDQRGTWRVEGGLLFMVPSPAYGPYYEFSALEVLNDGLCLVSRPPGQPTTLLTAEMPLGNCGKLLGVVIACSAGYGPKPLRRLLKSLLEDAEVPPNQIFCYMSGEREVNIAQGDIKVVQVERPAREFSPLVEIARNGPPVDGWNNTHGYVLLLHETCEVERDFWGRLNAVDVGLNYDLLLSTRTIGSNGWTNIGLYALPFLQERKDFFTGLSDPTRVRDLETGKAWADLLIQARLFGVLDAGAGATVLAKSRDVYGGGSPRSTVLLGALGIKKHSSKLMAMSAQPTPATASKGRMRFGDAKVAKSVAGGQK